MPMFAHQYRLATDYRGNGVLEDQLFLAIVLKQNRVFIERSNPSRQFHSAYQINGDRSFIFSDSVQKSILDVLSCFLFHCLLLRFYSPVVHC